MIELGKGGEERRKTEDRRRKTGDGRGKFVNDLSSEISNLTSKICLKAFQKCDELCLFGCRKVIVGIAAV